MQHKNVKWGRDREAILPSQLFVNKIAKTNDGKSHSEVSSPFLAVLLPQSHTTTHHVSVTAIYNYYIFWSIYKNVDYSQCTSMKK